MRRRRKKSRPFTFIFFMLLALLVYLELNRRTKSFRTDYRADYRTEGSKEYKDFLVALAHSESSGEHDAINQYRYTGLYQMGEAALHHVGVYEETRSVNYYNNDWSGRFTGKFGIKNYDDFLNSPEKQRRAIIAYHQIIDAFINRNGLHEFIGREIAEIKMTKSGMIAGAHLVGMGGLRDFLHSDGRVIPKDGNGFPITHYLKKFSVYTYHEVPG